MNPVATPMPREGRADARAWLATYLDHAGAWTIRHSTRSLADHLLGTFDLLGTWGCRPEVQAAGGLHSIHGTNVFAVACVPGEEGPMLAALVGADVARLVDLFHRIERPRAILEGLASGRLVDRFSGDALPASRAELEDLLAIECANLVEQGAHGRLLRGLSRLPADLLDALLPPGVARGVGQAMSVYGMVPAQRARGSID